MPNANSYGAILDALRGVSWPARRNVRGAAIGTHRSKMRGVSPEFAEYRPYRQGDDPRLLDWKLLARTDRAYMRITSDRAILGTVVIVDASASMKYRAGVNAKWEQACRLAVGLIAVAHASGDPVGLLVPTPEGLRYLAPRTRRGVVAEGARLLEGVSPAGSVPLTPAFTHVRRGYRIVVVSDLLGDGEALLRASHERIIGGGEVEAIHLIAREELDPPTTPAMATDPERPEIKRALVETTREGYLAAFAAWRLETARAWRDAGAGYTEVVTDEPAERAVRRVARDVRA